MGTLYMLREESLDDVYQKANDNRRIRATLSELEKTWQSLKSQATSEKLQSMARDGHCHEAVMWYVHHLSTQRHPCSEIDHAVCRAYEEQVTCASCHSNYVP